MLLVQSPNRQRERKNESLDMEFDTIKTEDPPRRQRCFQTTKEHRYYLHLESRMTWQFLKSVWTLLDLCM